MLPSHYKNNVPARYLSRLHKQWDEQKVMFVRNSCNHSSNTRAACNTPYPTSAGAILPLKRHQPELNHGMLLRTRWMVQRNVSNLEGGEGGERKF